jgi:hypothetical protein
MKKEFIMFNDKYAIGNIVIYHNPDKKGHGNRAKIISYLHRQGSDEISYVEIRFESGGLHVVPVHLLRKYYDVEGFPFKFTETP